VSFVFLVDKIDLDGKLVSEGILLCFVFSGIWEFWCLRCDVLMSVSRMIGFVFGIGISISVRVGFDVRCFDGVLLRIGIVSGSCSSGVLLIFLCFKEFLVYRFRI
jgi:hypothetical protein